MKISIIAAIAKNRTIGLNGKMPWNLPCDLKYFKEMTVGSVVIMGRKTFESIGCPLPDRVNIVITRNKDYKASGCIVFNSLIQALDYCIEKACIDGSGVFIIGGAELYQQGLKYADDIYLTELDKEYEGDTFFPEFSLDEWEIGSGSIKEDCDGVVCVFNRYVRIDNK